MVTDFSSVVTTNCLINIIIVYMCNCNPYYSAAHLEVEGEIPRELDTQGISDIVILLCCYQFVVYTNILPYLLFSAPSLSLSPPPCRVICRGVL